MSWQKYYRERTVSAAEAVSKIKSGDLVAVGHAAGAPESLLQAMTDRRGELTDVLLTHQLTLGRNPQYDPNLPNLEKSFRFSGCYLGAATRGPVAEGKGDFRPVFFWEYPALLRSPDHTPDVALVSVTEPDDQGRVSLGVSIDYTRQAVLSAKTVIAAVRPAMPFVHGEAVMNIKDFDWFVPDETPMPEHQTAEIGPIEQAIGRHIAGLIQDGDCLQLGIGNIPDAVLSMLDARRDLGLHSEMASDGVMRLAQKGVFNGARNNLHPGKLVLTFGMGSRKFYDWIDNNENIMGMPVDYVNDPRVIGGIDNMVSINSALSVDLQGQVAADSIGTRQYSGVGGQVDFVRGAHFSKGGRSIIAMPSTASGGKISRICASFGTGQPVTTSRFDVEYVVTEHGIANLRWRTNRERMRALIEIAAPQFREDLARQAREVYGILV
ncbi:MAG: 4-hydroxybutyrate CoA-transferase [Deltaproteobacteria bacterium]|jgi:4-hydroxybutyrate CoA-transferase|nr:4-hydroxybutyrate CoA-transferase [Deltaproteobacteria bacterium]